MTWKELIEKLNKDNSIHGILLQSPIPSHLDINEAFRKISPYLRRSILHGR